MKKNNGPKTLFLDVETAPNLATVWNIWNVNISLNQLLETSYVLCWSAKWQSEKIVMFDSVQKSGKDGVIHSIWKLLDSADIIIHYNGRRFDIPVLNKEFLLLGLKPPSPYKQIDLYQTVKKRFRFVSNKLAHITKQLGFEGKISTTHELWLKCMNGDKQAWKQMESYNKRDVSELVLVYDELLPWIDNHPNVGMYGNTSGKPVCTNCGSEHVKSKGIQYLATSTYTRYQCKDCGTWLRSNVCLKTDKKKLLKQIV